MQDGDYLCEQHGYVHPMQALTTALLTQILGFPENAHLVGIEWTKEERLLATTGDNTRRLLLQKLQERF